MCVSVCLFVHVYPVAIDCAKVCVKDSQWSSEETKALSEAQALYPAGQRFIPVAGEDGRTKKVG